MHAKKIARLRRAKKTRGRIKLQAIHRLSVHKTPRHIYAQVVSPDDSKIIASASTLDKKCRESIEYGGNITAASVIGQIIAERTKAAGIDKVAFDRAGFKYHGRVKALADAAREHGLNF